MSHDGNAGAILDTFNKTVTSSRNDQVNVLIELKERRNIRACLYGLNIVLREGCFRKSD